MEMRGPGHVQRRIIELFGTSIPSDPVVVARYWRRANIGIREWFRELLDGPAAELDEALRWLPRPPPT